MRHGSSNCWGDDLSGRFGQVGRFLAEVKHPISSGHHDRRTIAVHPLRRSGEACQHLLVHPATMSNGISLSNHLDRDSRGDQCIDSDFT